jgi:hypothetical protein
MDRKKIIQISLFVIVVGVLAGLLWWMFWREGSPITFPGQDPGQGGNLPTNQTGAPTGQVIDPVTGLPISGQITTPVVTSTPTTIPNTNQPVSDKALGGLTTAKTVVDKTVQDIVPVQDGKSFNYYDSRDNKFYHLNANGEIESLSDKQFFNVEKATWHQVLIKQFWSIQTELIFIMILLKINKSLCLPKWRNLIFLLVVKI